MKSRYSPRLCITLPPQLVSQVVKYQKKYDLKRSTIIQEALRDWLAKQPPLKPDAPDKPLLVAGQPFDPDKIYKDYLQPDMSGEEILQVLWDFEAAEKRYYNKA